MTNLLAALKNVTTTENGVVSNLSTNSKVLDFYFHVPIRRGQDDTQLFLDALNDDELLTLKALFYLRDIRGGKGERQTFRNLLFFLSNHNPKLFNVIIPLVVQYGRWDDLLVYWDNTTVVRFFRKQLFSDLSSETPSLLAKWLPSQNTSSKITVELANRWIDALGMTPPNYRKTLSAIRRNLNVVETKMSANKWGEINYSHVPSKANLNYRKAFSKHDANRYGEFINDAKGGKAKINSSVLYPHEIVSRVYRGQYDDTLEALWRQLPNYVGDKNALVVADVSGSMWFESARLHGSKFYAGDVSIALAIYFADKNIGPFAHHFITFSQNSQILEIKGNTLDEKVKNVQYGAGTNTNLQSVFDVLLTAAKRNHIKPEDMPDVIFICSDMQFDALDGNNETNFEAAKRKYATAGYDLPKLVFWNLASRQDEAPVTKDETGVYLASGFSTDTFDKVLNLDETKKPIKTPYDLMLNVLNGERYADVQLAYESYLGE